MVFSNYLMLHFVHRRGCGLSYCCGCVCRMRLLCRRTFAVLVVVLPLRRRRIWFCYHLLILTLLSLPRTKNRLFLIQKSFFSENFWNCLIDFFPSSDWRIFRLLWLVKKVFFLWIFSSFKDFSFFLTNLEYIEKESDLKVDQNCFHSSTQNSVLKY